MIVKDKPLTRIQPLGTNRNGCNTLSENSTIASFNDLENSDTNLTINDSLIENSKFIELRNKRYELMRIKKREKLLSGKSPYLCGCSQKLGTVSLESNSNNVSKISGITHCKSVYQCNVCRGKILNRRCDELDLVKKGHIDSYKDGGIVFLTLTAPHIFSDSFESILGSSKTKTGILGAMSYLISKDRGYKKLVDKYKIKMSCRVFETTWGATNGFHAHLHCLYYTEVKLTQNDLQCFQDDFYKLWINACQKSFLKIPDLAHGVKATDGLSLNSSSYLTKFKPSKWDTSSEMTLQDYKEAKNGNFTISDLECFLLNPDVSPLPIHKVKSVLKEYYKGCKGKLYLTWSDKERLHLKYLEKLNEVEKTDDEIFESDDSDSVVKVSIGVDIYNKEFFFKDKIHLLRNSFDKNKFQGVIDFCDFKKIKTSDIHLVYNKSMLEEDKLKKIDYYIQEFGFFPEFGNDLDKRDYYILNYTNLLNTALDYYSDSSSLAQNNAYYVYVIQFCRQYVVNVLNNSL